MKQVGILHLSDLHIENIIDNDKINSIVKACQEHVIHISHLYIVISGDVVNNGKPAEFQKAKDFVDSLLKKFKSIHQLLQIKLIIVPGNHDCDFSVAKATRKSLIKDCIKDIVEEDYFTELTVVQNNFWDFYKHINTIPNDKIAYKIIETPFLDTRISFNCYNSSWMSEIKEQYGQIVIPENKFLDNEENEIVVSVFHHPLSWLSPNTSNNNQSRFENHLVKTSNIVLYGHEHDSCHIQKIEQQKNNVIFSECNTLKKDTLSNIGFNLLILDLCSKQVTGYAYAYKENTFHIINQNKCYDIRNKNKKFTAKDTFLEHINGLKIPLKHSKKGTLQLSDIFIYPDLEPIIDDDVLQYVDSESLTNIQNNVPTKVIIEGDDQAGKTTLLFFLYKQLYDNYCLPVYVRCKEINTTNINDIIKKSVKEQYEEVDVDNFLQQKRIFLLIDNLQNLKLNPKYRAALLSNINKQFEYVIITTNNSTISNLAVDELQQLKDFNKYRILPLGYKKRGDLIEKWIRIGANEITIREEQIIDALKSRLAEINNLIGNRLMPSYPIFILTLLQGLDAQIMQDFSQTSYAHCYHALITAGLVKVGLKDKLDAYFNILTELSFYLFVNDNTFFSHCDFDTFFNNYKVNYISTDSSTQIITNLIDSNIIKVDDEYYSFSYKYIYYYLIAQKIARDIDSHESLIYDLCKDIHLEKNANILIFLTHHSKAQILIEHIVFSSNLPFEKFSPITLESGDPFYDFVSQFVLEIQGEMVKITDTNPKLELIKEQEEKDEIEQKFHADSGIDKNYEMPKEFIEINQSFQIIKILGQIVKNQSGSFEKNKLEELTISAYQNTFRLIHYFTTVFKNDKESIIDALCDELMDKSRKNIIQGDYFQKMNRAVIERKTNKFLQIMAFNICVDCITNLMFSVGVKGIDELYNSVASKIGSTAADIVTFAIKTYYGRINIHELEQLFEKEKNNPIALNILRFYVKKHLYTNYLEHQKKEKIIKIAGFKQNLIIPVDKSNK